MFSCVALDYRSCTLQRFLGYEAAFAEDGSPETKFYYTVTNPRMWVCSIGAFRSRRLHCTSYVSDWQPDSVHTASAWTSPFPRSTVDWDTSQADDFRTRGEPWTIKRARLGGGRALRSDRKGLV
jgi:hypothetical protein